MNKKSVWVIMGDYEDKNKIIAIPVIALPYGSTKQDAYKVLTRFIAAPSDVDRIMTRNAKRLWVEEVFEKEWWN